MSKTSSVAVEFRAYNRAASGLRSFTSGLDNVRRSVTRFGSAALAAAGVGGVGYLLAQQFKAIDAIGKMSDELQVSTRTLSGWSHAAQISGTNVETLHKGLQIFVRRIGEAQQGIGEAKHGLEALGMTADHLASMGTEQAFLEIAESIAQLGSATDRAQIAYAFFGRQGMNMLNMFLEGRKGISGLVDEAERLGLTFSRLDASQVEAANDALTRMRGAVTGVGRSMVIGLSPYVEALSDQITEAAANGQDFGDTMLTSLEAIAIAAAKVADVIGEISTAMGKLPKAAEEAGFWTTLDKQIDKDATAEYSFAMKQQGRPPRNVHTGYRKLTDQALYDQIRTEVEGRYMSQMSKDNLFGGGGILPGEAPKGSSIGGIQKYFQDLRNRARARAQKAQPHPWVALADQWLADPNAAPPPFAPGETGDGGTTTKKGMDPAAAYRRMAGDLNRYSPASYMAKQRLLQGELGQYGGALGNDPTLFEWWQHQNRNLEIDRLKGSDNWRDGFGAAALEAQRDMKTFGESGYDIATGWSDAFGSFFSQMRTGFDDLEGLARNLADQLASVLWEATVVAPLKNMVTQGFGSLLSPTPNALGNVFRSGRIVPFAKGGVFSGPTLFPMAGGNTGLLGEAGDEAVMPLARTRRGRLGIEASITGGAPNVAIQVVNNGQRKSAEIGQPRWDGNQWVIGVILDDLDHGGPLSDRLG